jgi:hypothetical protein
MRARLGSSRQPQVLEALPPLRETHSNKEKHEMVAKFTHELPCILVAPTNFPVIPVRDTEIL